jgi:hypothetical protein
MTAMACYSCVLVLAYPGLEWDDWIVCCGTTLFDLLMGMAGHR